MANPLPPPAVSAPQPLRFLSLFSGIEAASVAWNLLGWHALAFAEIEPFPCAVLAHHYPHVPNVGDVTQHDWTQYRGRCDFVVGGSPCQSFSLAGLRGSLKDARGCLALAFCKVVEDVAPRWVVYENVDGILSTEDNAFGCLIAGLVGGTEPVVPGTVNGKWSRAGVVCGPRRAAAWRVLDAQYVAVAGDSAVPQRRNRVFVVSRDFGDLGELAIGSPQRDADRVCGLLAEILFEPESLRRDSAPRREAGADIAGALTSSPSTSRSPNEDSTLIALTLLGKSNSSHDESLETYITQAFGGGNCSGSIDVATCLTRHGTRQDFDTETFVTHTLRGEGFDASEDGTGRGIPLVFDTLTGNGDAHGGFRDERGLVAYGISSDCLDRTGDAESGAAGDRAGLGITENLSPSLRNRHPNAVAYEAPIPIDMRQASRGGTMTNNRSEGACSGGAPGTGIGEAGDPAPSLSQSHPPAVAYQPLPFDTTQITSKGNYSNPKPGDICHPLPAHGHPAAIAFQERGREGGRSLEYQPDLAYALTAPKGGGRHQELNVHDGMVVRRMTPIECERLMGFPEDYTLVIYRSKPAADGPRYKALGNSIVTKCLRWIGHRINAVRAAREIS